MALIALAWGAPRVSSAQQPASPSGGSASGSVPRNRILPPWRFVVRADNDAFNFWQPVPQRPDKEYTNGDEVMVELSSAPWWGKHFAPRRHPCTGAESAGDRCLTTSFVLGQDMYTPRPHHEPGVVTNWRDERPYAAWLYLGATARVLSERSLRTVGLTLGVTGPPAAGEFAQRTAHKLTGVYSRDPIGWDTQIGFEPGVIVSASESRRFVARTASGRPVADFIPEAGASLGNILTAGDVGFRTRFGVNLSSPWWTSEWSRRGRGELYLIAGARGAAVARNITLDGNTLGADRHVDRVPLVGEYTLGVGGRYRELVVEWRATTRGREYRTGPRGHAFSTVYVSYEVPARAP